jgi:hypothetical protein
MHGFAKSQVIVTDGDDPNHASYLYRATAVLVRQLERAPNTRSLLGAKRSKPGCGCSSDHDGHLQRMTASETRGGHRHLHWGGAWCLKRCCRRRWHFLHGGGAWCLKRSCRRHRTHNKKRTKKPRLACISLYVASGIGAVKGAA